MFILSGSFNEPLFYFYIMIEHYFTCPYCWQTISVLLDNSVKTQNYIEDCEVCCNPIQIKFKFINSELFHFDAISLEQ